MKSDKEVQETYDRISGIVKGKLNKSFDEIILDKAAQHALEAIGNSSIYISKHCNSDVIEFAFESGAKAAVEALGEVENQPLTESALNEMIIKLKSWGYHVSQVDQFKEMELHRELTTLEAQNAELKKILSDALPIVKDAYLEQHNAGTRPGYGYFQRAQHRAGDLFDWRNSKKFYEWHDRATRLTDGSKDEYREA